MTLGFGPGRCSLSDSPAVRLAPRQREVSWDSACFLRRSCATPSASATSNGIRSGWSRVRLSDIARSRRRPSTTSSASWPSAFQARFLPRSARTRLAARGGFARSATIPEPGTQERSKRDEHEGGQQRDDDLDDAMLPSVAGLEQGQLARRVAQVDGRGITVRRCLRSATVTQLLAHRARPRPLAIRGRGSSVRSSRSSVRSALPRTR